MKNIKYLAVLVILSLLSYGAYRIDKNVRSVMAEGSSQTTRITNITERQIDNINTGTEVLVGNFLGYTRILSTLTLVAGSSATTLDITELLINVNIPENNRRYIKITLFLPEVSPNNIDAYSTRYLIRDQNNAIINSVVHEVEFGVAGETQPVILSGIIRPSGGAHTYKASVRLFSSGSINIIARGDGSGGGVIDNYPYLLAEYILP